jgi:hypothetical protein
VVSILKPGKYPTSYYRPISLLDSISKLFEKILLARDLGEISALGLLLDKQFGLRPRHSMTLQLASVVEGVNRNFDERRLTGTVFLYATKAFDTAWDKDLLCKLTVLNLPST